MSLIPNGDTTEAVVEEIVTETTAALGNEEGYLFADGVKGEGQTPAWFKSSKYKTISAQAEGYNELESKFGSFTGMPKDGYSIEGMDLEESPLLKLAAEWGAENQLSNAGLESLLTKVNELATSQIEEDSVSVKAALGEKADSRLNNIAQWGKNNLTSDEFAQFQGLAQTAGHIEVIEKLIGMSKNSKMVNVEAEIQNNEDVESELKEMQLATNDDGKRLVDIDPAYRAKFSKKMAEHYNK